MARPRPTVAPTTVTRQRLAAPAAPTTPAPEQRSFPHSGMRLRCRQGGGGARACAKGRWLTLIRKSGRFHWWHRPLRNLFCAFKLIPGSLDHPLDDAQISRNFPDFGIAIKSATGQTFDHCQHFLKTTADHSQLMSPQHNADPITGLGLGGWADRGSSVSYRLTAFKIIAADFQTTLILVTSIISDSSNSLILMKRRLSVTG